MMVKCINFRPDKPVKVSPDLFKPTTKLPMGVMMNHIHWCLDDFWNEGVTIKTSKNARKNK